MVEKGFKHLLSSVHIKLLLYFSFFLIFRYVANIQLQTKQSVGNAHFKSSKGVGRRHGCNEDRKEMLKGICVSAVVVKDKQGMEEHSGRL